MLAQARFRLSFATGLMILGTTADAQRAATDLHRMATMAGRSPVYAPNGVAATSQPLTSERLHEQLGRLGGTPFTLGTLESFLEGAVILPIKELNR